MDPAHPADVDDNAGRRRVAAVAVAAGPRDDVDPVLSRPANGPLDIRDGLAEDDRVRPHAVEASADKKPCVRVGGAAGCDDGAVELARELAQASIGGGSGESHGPGRHRAEGAGGESRPPRTLEELAPVEAVHEQRLARGSSGRSIASRVVSERMSCQVRPIWRAGVWCEGLPGRLVAIPALTARAFP
jgi:hypothetical protein